MDSESPLGDQKWKARKRQRKSLNYSLNLLRTSQQVDSMDLTMKSKQPKEENCITASTNSRKSETPIKRVKKEDLNDDELNPEDPNSAPRRSLPHRAARFMESYSTIAGVDEVVEEEKQQNGDDQSESDSDVEVIPKSPLIPLTEEQQNDWEERKSVLQKNLRNEEIKLVLLRKLKESQNKKEEKKEEPNYPIPSHVKMSHKLLQKNQLQITNISTESPTKKLLPPSRSVPQLKPQDLSSKPDSGHSSSPNHIAGLNSENLSKSNISIVPVTSKSSSNSHRSSLPVKNEVSISIVPQPKHTPPPPPPPPAQPTKAEKEMSSQQQAIAKMALRKQLEKTLLQIPTPRPKVPKLNFIPNGSSPEFVWLLGLDIVVDFITKVKPLDLKPKDPYVCSQCKTNFSETWNTVRESKSKRAIICQMCYSNNAKKSLKQEHTSHLKAAFVKALQQEKEIERLSHTFTRNSSPAMPTNLVSTAAQPSYSQPVFSKSVSSSRTTTTTPTAPNPNLFLNNSLFMQQFSKLTPQQLQALLQVQAQSFMSANLPLPAHMIPFSPFLAQYPFHLLNKAGTTQNDLQRQYLLDMIPPASSHGASTKRKR